MYSECFEVAKDRIYRIVEKVDDSTPGALREINRYKMVSYTAEPARCLFVGNPETGRYDTGFDENSSEFRGKSKTEITKILKERKNLIDWYESKLANYIKTNPNLTEKDFLASEHCGIDLSHNSIIDTADMDKYFKLYLAYRGGQITPNCDGSNPRYNGSLYAIVDTTKTTNDQTSTSEKKLEVMTWFGNMYAKDSDKLKQYLQYVGALRRGQSATKGVMLSLLERWVSDVRNLDYILETIKNTDYEEVLIKNRISDFIKRRKIIKEEGTFYFEGEKLGRTTQQAYVTLTKVGNEELLEQLQSE